MSVGVAWTTLGFDSREVIQKLFRVPRAQRVEAAREALEDAKKSAKRLLGAHHPDTGGDPEKFRRVKEALETIERETEVFAQKMAALGTAEEEMASKRPFIKFEK
jgi:hypothetical protein